VSKNDQGILFSQHQKCTYIISGSFCQYTYRLMHTTTNLFEGNNLEELRVFADVVTNDDLTKVKMRLMMCPMQWMFRLGSLEWKN